MAVMAHEKSNKWRSAQHMALMAKWRRSVNESSKRHKLGVGEKYRRGGSSGNLSIMKMAASSTANNQ